MRSLILPPFSGIAPGRITGQPFLLDLARNFNSASDIINIGGGFSLPTTFTITSWLNDGGGAANRPFFGGSGTGSIEFRVGASGKLELLSCGLASIGLSTGTITVSTWTHVAVTYDGTNFAFYIAGAASGSGSNAQTITPPANYEIGDCTAVSEVYVGSVADVAVWSKFLSASEISALANKTRPNGIGENATLIGWWPLGQGSPEPDKSGNGNVGTVTGTTIVAGPF